MALKRIFKILLLCVACFLMVGCSNKTDYSEYTKVVYYLEGGKFQNCTEPITQYYNFKEGTSNLIKDPAELKNSTYTKDGYKFDGWYQTKTEVSEGVYEYSDKWDFESSKVTNEGVTLYAKWKKNISLTYTVGYMEEGEFIELGEYEVDPGDKFNDYLNYKDDNPGNVTAIGYVDYPSDEYSWNSDFEFPDSESDLDIKIVVEYIEGTFELVSTASELKKSLNKNIYLMCDIDMDGASLSFSNYSKIFKGNGHKIYNFSVNYNAKELATDYEDSGKTSLYVSIFGETSGAEVYDVTFENVTFDISCGSSKTNKIVLAPIVIKSSNSIFNNVSVSATYIITKTPNNFNSEENLILIDNLAYYISDESSSFENITINISK